MTSGGGLAVGVSHAKTTLDGAVTSDEVEGAKRRGRDSDVVSTGNGGVGLGGGG